MGLVELLQNILCGSRILVRNQNPAFDRQNAALDRCGETVRHEGVAASLLQQDHGVVEPDGVIGSQDFDHFRDNLPRR